MFPWADLQADASPSEEFVTTYQHDFRPMSERQPWLRIRPAPGFTSSCQNECERLPVFVEHISAVGSSLTEASVQEAGVPEETRLLFDPGSTVNMLEQLEPKDGSQYQEGVILLSQDADTFSCEDVLKILGEETGAQFLLSQLVVSGRIIKPDQNKGVFNFILKTKNWQDLTPVRTFSPSEQTPERPAGYSETKDVPPPSGQIGQQRPNLTEYQDKFCAQWFQPQNQTSHILQSEDSSTSTSIRS